MAVTSFQMLIELVLFYPSIIFLLENALPEKFGFFFSEDEKIFQIPYQFQILWETIIGKVWVT